MMTLNEYSLRIEVYRLQELDNQEKIAMMAFYNQLAQSTTGGNKPKIKYDQFDKLFDREKEERKIRKTFGDEYVMRTSQSSESFASKFEEFQKLKKAGKIDKNAWKKVVKRKGGG